MSVQVDCRFAEPKAFYSPGDELQCELTLAGLDSVKVRALELSVLFRTSGKGSEDIKVHHFEQLSRPADPAAVPGGGQVHQFSTRLPQSPLSYQGMVLQIEWLVRLMVLGRGSPPRVFDFPFQLGSVARPGAVEVAVEDLQTHLAETREGDARRDMGGSVDEGDRILSDESPAAGESDPS